jgi:hypothetical protein
MAYFNVLTYRKENFTGECTNSLIKLAILNEKDFNWRINVDFEGGV